MTPILGCGRIAILRAQPVLALVDLLLLLDVDAPPQRAVLRPAYGRKAFDREAMRKTFVLLASKDGRDGSLQVQQDVDLWVTAMGAGESREFGLGSGRHACVQVARGSVTVNGRALREGDGAALTGEESLRLRGEEPAEVLLFDLA